MRNRSLLGVAACFFPIVLGAVSGCGYFGMSENSPGEWGALELVMKTVGPNMGRRPEWSYIEFSMGELEGGCSVLLVNGGEISNQHMFWVQNGVVYAVNDAAKDLAPQQPAAPAAVTYEKAVAVVH